MGAAIDSEDSVGAILAEELAAMKTGAEDMEVSLAGGPGIKRHPPDTRENF